VNILPQDKWDAMMWLLGQGETQREIARRVGIDRGTVRKAAHECGDALSRSDAMRRYHQRRRDSAAKR
jgi:DNA-directed RNA polymerase specialized sigma24 family protein